MTQVNVDIPDELYLEFKVECIKRGITVKQKVIELIQEFNKKTNKKKGDKNW